MRDITRDEFGYPMTGLGQPATSLISTKVTGQQLQPTAAPTMPGRGVPNPMGINELTSLRDFSALPMGRTQNPTPLPMSSMTNPNSVGTVGEPGVGGTPGATAPRLDVTGSFGGAQRYRSGLMGTPDATPGLGGPVPRGNDMWGFREEQKRIREKLLNLSEQDFNNWLNSDGGGGRPGSMGAEMIAARRRKAAGIPPGAVSIANKDGSFGRYKMPGGEVWETNGQGGWRKPRPGGQYLQDEWGSAPEVKEPRKFSWREGEQAPQRDWEAILDFQKFVGSRPGPYVEGKGRTINLDVDKALKNPGMVNESFAKNLTVTNLTPELRSSLEAKGFKFKTWDEKLFPNMNKLGDGKLGIIEFESAVDAMKSLAALKAAGAATNMEGFSDARNMKFYG